MTRRIDPVSVLVALALFAVALAIGGCGAPDVPYGTWAERPDTATAVDMGNHCDNPDSFDVALIPGDDCGPFTVPCVVPVSCPVAAAEYRSKCVDGKCCQFAIATSGITYRDCGDGIMAVPRD